ncbi:MAG: hypothetical protein A4E38_00905 [Methanoregulaceae archaeon PtaB.Bin108]|nr:MAG: hypothetical protein A4E38_00905 [Methanoregulaceae archaeon PtaB.Bin108]
MVTENGFPLTTSATFDAMATRSEAILTWTGMGRPVPGTPWRLSWSRLIL